MVENICKWTKKVRVRETNAKEETMERVPRRFAKQGKPTRYGNRIIGFVHREWPLKSNWWMGRDNTERKLTWRATLQTNFHGSYRSGSTFYLERQTRSLEPLLLSKKLGLVRGPGEKKDNRFFIPRFFFSGDFRRLNKLFIWAERGFFALSREYKWVDLPLL